MGWGDRVRRFLWRWGAPLVWMGLIFVASAQPKLPHASSRWLDFMLKKGGHALAYGILAWLYLWALRGRFRDERVLRLVSIGLAVAYGLSDEYHQTFVPGRNGALFDVAVDGVGACGAMLLDWRWRASVRQRSDAR
jgi:VanZ family protein